MPTTTINQIISSCQDSFEEQDNYEALLETTIRLFELGDRIIERTRQMEQFERDNHLIY